MTDIDKLLDGQKAKNEEEIGAEKWEPSAGDIKQGAIQKIGWYDGGDYAPSMYLLLKDFEAEETFRVYCSTVLRNQLLEEAPAIGQPIVIRYEGKVQGKNRKYHSWTLALIPNAEGLVKRDQKLWHEHGTYRGEQKQVASRDDDDMSFF